MKAVGVKLSAVWFLFMEVTPFGMVIITSNYLLQHP